MLSLADQKVEHCLSRGGSRFRLGKSLVPDRNRGPGQTTKDCVDRNHCATKRVQISACTVQNSVPKMEGKHLIFKANVAGIKTYLLVDNGSKAKLIDQSFVRANKISTFKLK